MRLLVTGGAGFIGSHYVRHVLRTYPRDEVVAFDKLTYAGNIANLADVADDARFTFTRGDIADPEAVAAAMQGVDAIINFAAETHVDRSLMDPASFIETDVRGVYTLLEAAHRKGGVRFVQISTDEVYGSIPEGSFSESDSLNPSSPYSASKAGGEMMVMAYRTTYGLDTVITRGSNTYGPNQYPEKLIPLFATNALDGEPLPLYGDGRQVRDWIHVSDHVRAVDLLLRKGAPGGVYNIGGGNERTNRWITDQVLALTGRDAGLIRHVADRPGHDVRYSVETSRLRALGWAPQVDLVDGLRETVEWYRARRDWWEPIKSGEFRAWYAAQYRDPA